MSKDNGHFYDWQGQPHHFIECKTRDGTRPTTISDCRREKWLPSITTVLKVVAKAALEQWKIQNAILAALTTPRREHEQLDAFVERIMSRDAEDVSDKAKSLGSDVHKSIEEHLAGRLYAPQFKPFVEAAVNNIAQFGRVIASEKTYVHPMGFAGTADCVCEGLTVTVIDFKTCTKIPKAPWPEAMMQTAALADSFGNTGDKYIQTAVLYLSTVEPGKTELFTCQSWKPNLEAFKHAFALWKYINAYSPPQKPS